MTHYPSSREHNITMSQVRDSLCSVCEINNARTDGTDFLYACAPCTAQHESSVIEQRKMQYLETMEKNIHVKLDEILRLISSYDDF